MRPTLPTVVLKQTVHRQQEVLSFHFEKNHSISYRIKNELYGSWSQTRRFWYIHYTAINIDLASEVLNDIAFIDMASIKFKKERSRYNMEQIVLSYQDNLQIDRFKKWLETKRYSDATINTYASLVIFFCKYLIKKNCTALTPMMVSRFNYEFIVQPKKSISYQNQAINAIKQYFEYCGIEVEFGEIERPKREKKLPIILSMEEVKRIIDCAHNLRHKTLLSLIYSGGFRLSEAINLKISDIDSERMLIHIKSAKGRKDRYTLLSKNILVIMREYYRVYAPKIYLFENKNLLPYSQRSVQSVLKMAVTRAGITKHVTPHSLRHSFATHLLENGTDIRYIQNLLGHSSPKTTMIYTHVSEMAVQKIRNPFDIMLASEQTTTNSNKF